MSTKLWIETIDPNTGESSLKTHTLRTVATWCAPSKHYFTVDVIKRQATCEKCGYETTYIPGHHVLTDGRLETPHM